MSSYSSSYSYTVVDVRRVACEFAADYAMLAQVTGAESEEEVGRVVHDVRILMEHGYLSKVHLVFRDAHGRKIRARSYSVTTDAYGWANDGAGANRWPYDPNGSLIVVLCYTADWKQMTQAQQARFRADKGFQVSWVTSDEDTTHSELSYNGLRRFASNGYGMERQDFS